MSNIISHKPDIGDVVMPLIRMLAQPGLSWAQRAEIADAIGACERQWRDMEKERHMLNQQQCVGAAQQSTGQSQQSGQNQASNEFLRTHPQPLGSQTLGLRGHYP